MASDELAQRRRGTESRAWDRVLDAWTDAQDTCPLCGVLDLIADCELCGQPMCGMCFAKHEASCDEKGVG